MIRYILLSLPIFILMVSCSQAAQDIYSRPGDQNSYMIKKITISEILENPLLNGQTVVVEGRYLGWTSCDSKTTMLTRSDWVLKDSTGCIFVTGGMPPGIRPYSASQTHPELITIKAKIEWIGGKVVIILVK